MEPSADYTVRCASSEGDLHGIVALQSANLPENLDEAQRREHGFVTLRHDVALLREMNAPWPHVIATPAGTNEIAGYALVMLPRFRHRLPVLEPMFEQLDELQRPGGSLEGLSFYVMGQVCVARPHRGRGLVERLYAEHRARMSGTFDLMITEIDRSNPRSVRAHEKAGFDVIREYGTGDGREWLIVGLDLRPHR